MKNSEFTKTHIFRGNRRIYEAYKHLDSIYSRVKNNAMAPVLPERSNHIRKILSSYHFTSLAV